MKSVTSLFVLLSLSLFSRATAQDDKFTLTLFDHPPHGVYARTRGLNISARIDDPHSTKVTEEIRAFVETVAPGKDLMIAYSAPSGIASSPFLELTIEPIVLDRRTLNCQVSYSASKPNPPEIDKAVLKATELAHAMEPQTDVMTMAFVGDDSLSDTDYDGTLLYDSKACRIMTLDEHSGTKVAKSDKGDYLLIVKESKPIIRGDKRRAIISVDLVFPNRPSTAEAKRLMLAETLKLRSRDVDIITAPYVGPKDKATAWEPMKDETDSFNRYLLLEYSGERDTLTEYGKSLSVK
jgi:hypothetical protein